MIRDEIVLKEDAERTFAKALELEESIEAEYERIVWREIKDHPVVDGWLIKVRGIGPRLAGLLVAIIGDIERFATISKLWAYAGLHTKDGRAVKRAKGEKANWSGELKMTCWKIAGSFLKAGGPYKELYDSYKQYLVTRELDNGNVIWKTSADSSKVEIAHCPKSLAHDPPKPPTKPEWTLGRIHNMAMRRTAKLFLSHLWSAWREIEGLPASKPFAIERLGHESYIDHWKMVDEK